MEWDNEEMKLAWQLIAETDVSVFLTGKAGTGKTTFLRRLREAMPKRMVVLAPTGVAAINAQGQTLHSFFQLPFGPNVPGAQTERKSYYKVGKEKKNIIRTLDLLVIDEISMVRCDLLDAVDEELRKYRDRYKPFGGVQLLLIGDLQQLAPVAKETEWQLLSSYYDSPYFFGSKALRSIQLVTVELRHIYRQSDARFIDILAKVRTNTLDAATLDALNSRYVADFEPKEGEDWIRLTTHNNMANAYNERKLQALTSPSSSFMARISKVFPETSYPADENLVLKVGAQVMFIKNDPSGNHAYYNGKIGVVRGISKDEIAVWCKEDGKEVKVERVVWENTKYVLDENTKEIREEIEGTFSQFPLRLAWAITVHKSQGLTFDHAVLDINSSFAHGQTYVALSRCRTLEGMVLAHPLTSNSVITDMSVNAYVDQKLAEAETVRGNLPQMQSAYYLHLLDEMFSFTVLANGYDYLTRVVDEHLYNQHSDYLKLLKERQDDIKKSLVDVAAAFRIQYVRILQTEGMDSPHLKERIGASVGYFQKKMLDIFTPVMEAWGIRIENKSVSTQYNNALDAFKLSLAIKLGVFKSVGDEGFSVKNYLAAKAKASLNDLAPHREKASSGGKTVKEKAVKKEKAPKGESQRQTLRMFREGKSIAEIAAERSLTQSTIEGHLASFVETGELSIDSIVSAHHQNVIRATVKAFDKSYTLSEVKAQLPDDYSYGEIRLVIADMAKEG